MADLPERTDNRLTLKQALVNIGAENLGAYHCGCGRLTPSEDLVDARQYEDLPGQFVCRICISCKDREEKAILEAMAPWPTEEQLNDLRAERDIRLIKTDHTQLYDYRQALTEQQLNLIDDYRAAVRNVVKLAKEGERATFPDLPNLDPEEEI